MSKCATFCFFIICICLLSSWTRSLDRSMVLQMIHCSSLVTWSLVYMYTHGISHTYMYMYHYSDYCMNSVSFFVQNSYNDIIISIFVAYLHRQNHNPNLHVPNLTCNTYPIMIYTCTYKCTVQVHKMRHITHMKIINSTCTYNVHIMCTFYYDNDKQSEISLQHGFNLMHQSTSECHTDIS